MGRGERHVDPWPEDIQYFAKSEDHLVRLSACLLMRQEPVNPERIHSKRSHGKRFRGGPVDPAAFGRIVAVADQHSLLALGNPYAIYLPTYARRVTSGWCFTSLVEGAIFWPSSNVSSESPLTDAVVCGATMYTLYRYLVHLNDRRVLFLLPGCDLFDDSANRTQEWFHMKSSGH